MLRTVDDIEEDIEDCKREISNCGSNIESTKTQISDIREEAEFHKGQLFALLGEGTWESDGDCRLSEAVDLLTDLTQDHLEFETRLVDLCIESAEAKKKKE